VKRIGAHVSIAGGVQNAVANAVELGATAIGMFTRNQRIWKQRPLAEEDAAAFRDALGEHGFAPQHVLPHDSYLINLGSSDPEVVAKSRAAFLDEMRRCQMLGLCYLNFHPGAPKQGADLSVERCIEQIAGHVNETLAQTEGVTAVVECTAGQGTNVGRTFAELAALIERIADPARAGVCLDTCHLFAAGYDLRTRDGYERMLDEFDATVGLRHLRGWHLNDSKGDLGSRVDRHAAIGAGLIGREPFTWIVQDSRFEEMPMILETPEPENWAAEIAELQRLAAQVAQG
jgi:deoxyribonuclease-4